MVAALKESGLELYGLGKDRFKFLSVCADFANMVAAKKHEDIETLYALYKQACEQRDALMDQQRAQIAAMRGQLQ